MCNPQGRPSHSSVDINKLMMMDDGGKYDEANASLLNFSQTSRNTATSAI
jgi:hypothetical protein